MQGVSLMSKAKFRKVYGKNGSGRFVVSEGHTSCGPTICPDCEAWMHSDGTNMDLWICDNCGRNQDLYGKKVEDG